MQVTAENSRAALSAVDIKNEVLAGLTTSFAMVPEVVAFAFVAGVNPLVGLYAAFTVGFITAILGGRPGMISGAAGSLAVVSTALVSSHGVDYLFAAVVLMGIIQIAVGLFKWGKFISLVPHPVMLGFVNGLAIVIFLAQLKHFVPPGLEGKEFWLFGKFWLMVGLVALTMGITHFLPRFSKAIPSSLAAIIVVTVLVHVFHLDTQTVGGIAGVSGAFPKFHQPSVPFNLETLHLLLPYAVILAGVGLTESLLTLTVVDDLTQTQGDNDRECLGQGVANLVTGFMGGMGGCAMIGQSIINVSSGGRRRLSGIVEALCILGFIVFASKLIESVPMAALIGVMFIVVIETFAWSSLRIIRAIPKSDAGVLVLVTIVTVMSNLAVAVLIGVIASALSFAWKQGTNILVKRVVEEGRSVYHVHGSLFFASVKSFTGQFDPQNDPAETEIDFSDARLHDHSALEALYALNKRYEELGKELVISNISESSQMLLTRAPWVTVKRA